MSQERPSDSVQHGSALAARALSRFPWRRLALHYAFVLALCAVIAVLTTLIWPRNHYGRQFLYACCVGTLTWLVVEAGRYAFPAAQRHPDADGGPGWPKGWRGVALSAAGILCGFVFGERLADWLTGEVVVPSQRDNTISLAITVVAGAAATWFFHARGQAAALRARIATTERDASEARLKLLETQLEPHMLFNTLANLRVLVATDPPRAQAMLDHLIDYLRATLAGSRATEHTLADEFDRLRDYLELMAVRMGSRLAYTLELPDALRDAPVPALLLQPLVENAIRHGLEPQRAGGRIVVSARALAGQLVLRVEDDGAGLAAGGQPGTGFGLAQVCERLAARYGAERSALEIVAREAGGVLATATFPFKTMP